MNLLFLDEPTNHLDMASKDVLLDALKNFKGTIIFVSHDHYFVDALATKVLELNSEKCRLYYGDYSYYLWKKEQGDNGISEQAETRQKKTQKGKQIQNQSRELKSKIRKLENSEAEILVKLEEIDKEKSEISRKMADEKVYTDGDKIKELKTKLEYLENEQTELSLKWENIERELSELWEK
jgi:ATP-binding cassette subfamily F protein 3